ncbi:MAG: hypothetical protein AB8H86_15540 [Polyangiales bacterium]
MSNQWVLPVLLAALVGSAATAMGFMLGSKDEGEATPVALPEECAPVACEPVACEPVACVEPEPTAPAPSRMRRRRHRPTDQVLNPWDDADRRPPTTEPTTTPEPTPPTMGETSNVLDPFAR